MAIGVNWRVSAKTLADGAAMRLAGERASAAV
jgi:hypothetical protein